MPALVVRSPWHELPGPFQPGIFLLSPAYPTPGHAPVCFYRLLEANQKYLPEKYRHRRRREQSHLRIRNQRRGLKVKNEQENEGEEFHLLRHAL